MEPVVLFHLTGFVPFKDVVHFKFINSIFIVTLLITLNIYIILTEL